ncbi:hook-basal body complex protein FliE [Succinivibrio dextrinosolvens]|uniref:flagellar hook-basal body complex protein FliE n=1 Tax=Succinivibrio dextrinosolvens TaxID=83771 RepID=UPI0008E1345A|nr:flagellar hook-basal body complex protein FliE [Succinivibrio dextrinosolvens]SFS90272.1 hook-basal body complex protein FliE [Succinivibrio dextrinosolvens]
MSLMINPLVANPTMLNQLQRMQQNMRSLQVASTGTKDTLQQKIENAPLMVPGQGGTDKTDSVQPKDNIGAFANMLHEAFENVNTLQNDAANKQTRFDLGDRKVTLSDVMLATQKAGLSFDATVQIRNKMIEAYRTISQMQI